MENRTAILGKAQFYIRLDCQFPLLLLIFVAGLCISLPVRAQQPSQAIPRTSIQFRNGAITSFSRPSDPTAMKAFLSASHRGKSNYGILQFSSIPTQEEKKNMAAAGIRLYNPFAGNNYLGELRDNISAADLQQFGITGLQTLPARYKLVSRKTLTTGQQVDGWEPDQLFAAGYFGSLEENEVIHELSAAGATIVPTRRKPEHAVLLKASKKALENIAGLPFISYLIPQSIQALPLVYVNRATHALDALNNPSGRNLFGQGVTVGIGDNASPYTHIDLSGHLIDRFAGPLSAHGTLTSGIMAGGGILDPRYRGMAPRATLVSQYFTDILTNSPTYINDYDMVVTNNSYSNSVPGCGNEGLYDADANYVDGQMQAYPNLLHVFAAGNDGGYSCNPYIAPFATIKTGFQCAKDPLIVGALDNYYNVINSASSCGPVSDGRLKPEIVAGGMNVFGPLPNNTYGSSNGTSLSSPTVAGAMALLIQRYRQLYANADPPAALIKTVACNSATDMGNPGPDFIFGFGSLNARNAVETIEKGQFFTGAIGNNGSATFTVTGIPAGLQQIKIMLYWPDPPALPNAAASLVNDLDLIVNSPDGIQHHPLILNPDPAHVNDPATEGYDHLNNIEQVVINQPPGGSFTIHVQGTSVPSGPQPYFIAYQLIQPSVTVEYPFGGETWVPGQPEILRWTAYGGDTNPFTIEYSADNGSTWTTISNSVPASSRLYNWTTPSTPTNQGLIRISRNGTPYKDVSDLNFTILGQPTLTVTNPCQGYAQLNWNSITGATGYEIMKLNGDTMGVIATTSSTNALLSDLNRDSTYWFAVRADNGSAAGRRSVAVSVIPAAGACTIAAANNDLTIDSLIGPANGRQFTTSQLGTNTPITIELKNLGSIATTNPIAINYQINGGTVVSETIPAAMAAHGKLNYTFTHRPDLSAPGAYYLQCWTSYPGDPQSANDTLTTILKQLANPALSLNPAYTEGFETAADTTYTSSVNGFTGLDRADIRFSDANGRARTFVNSGFARTGNRSAILDEQHFNSNSSTDSLILTFNLSNYSNTDQLWLDFYYRNQGIDFSLPGNQVWIRGDDHSAWIPVHTLDISPANFGAYQAAPHIDITGILSGASPTQAVSGSFQIKFGEQGYTSANSVVTDGNLDDGYIFDDITLTHASNDIALTALLTPQSTAVCALSSAEPITVRVKNYGRTTATNIPVTYDIDGTTVTEYIPSIAPQDSIAYTFTHKADLSAIRVYSIQSWVSNPGDTYPLNDSIPVISFRTQPLIASFPYLEGFEKGDGSWYTSGVNDSWQWGKPDKPVITRAANGVNCWTTNLTGDYNNNELSYLYSPCFDLSSLASPVLSFSHIFQTEDDCDCDYHWIEYSTDGQKWWRLGFGGDGVNWFDYYPTQSWQKSDTSWHVTSIDIPPQTSPIRFRFVMKSDGAQTYAGVGIDDIHIFDKAPIYTGPGPAGGLTQPLSGSGWIDFNTSGGRIVSVNPNGQDLGNTTVKVFNHQGPVRNDGIQYYGNRNIVITPTNPPTAAVSVRFYFTEAEMDSLILAGGCPGCANIADAYQAGIMQYSSPVLTEEDSTLANDSSGTFHFFPPHKTLAIIPNDEGYYAEYQVSGFSEFWINTGSPGPGRSLPLALLSFTAVRSGKNALLQWSATGESHTMRYAVEKSRDNKSFLPLDSLPASGDTADINNYQYTDRHLWDGINYYRLRMVETDGQIKYAPVRTVSDTLSSLVVSVYPNPVRNGLLYISTSFNCDQVILTDASGRVVLQRETNGFLNILPVAGLAGGIYFARIRTDGGTVIVKILLI